jgi:hypothetical protein
VKNGIFSEIVRRNLRKQPEELNRVPGKPEFAAHEFDVLLWLMRSSVLRRDRGRLQSSPSTTRVFRAREPWISWVSMSGCSVTGSTVARHAGLVRTLMKLLVFWIADDSMVGSTQHVSGSLGHECLYAGLLAMRRFVFHL